MEIRTKFDSSKPRNSPTTTSTVEQWMITARSDMVANAVMTCTWRAHRRKKVGEYSFSFVVAVFELNTYLKWYGFKILLGV